jgi:hypothetical protein
MRLVARVTDVNGRRHSVPIDRIRYALDRPDGSVLVNFADDELGTVHSEDEALVISSVVPLPAGSLLLTASPHLTGVEPAFASLSWQGLAGVGQLAGVVTVTGVYEFAFKPAEEALFVPPGSVWYWDQDGQISEQINDPLVFVRRMRDCLKEMEASQQ